MARFYGEVFGAARTVASRLGRSDIGAHVRGWNVGVKVEGYADDGADVFRIWATAGSHAASSSVFLGSVALDDNGRPTFHPSEDGN